MSNKKINISSISNSTEYLSGLSSQFSLFINGIQECDGF